MTSIKFKYDESENEYELRQVVQNNKFTSLVELYKNGKFMGVPTIRELVNKEEY